MGRRRSFSDQEGANAGYAVPSVPSEAEIGETALVEFAESATTRIRPVYGSVATELLGDSFAEVVEHYQAPLISFLYGMVGNREQAEDLAQDTLIKAFEAMERRRRRQADSRQEFSAGWLFRIARNTAIDALRRKRLIAWLPFAAEHEAVLPSRGDFVGKLADRELVQQVLSRLPTRYRTCLLLRAVVGMSNGEIAETLGISVRNVNTSLFRARERFRQVYNQLEGATTPGTTGAPPARQERETDLLSPLSPDPALAEGEAE